MSLIRVAARTAEARLVVCVGKVPARGTVLRTVGTAHTYRIEEVQIYERPKPGASGSYFGLRLGGDAPVPKVGMELEHA